MAPGAHPPAAALRSLDSIWPVEPFSFQLSLLTIYTFRRHHDDCRTT
jgi:hypothetical protein